MSSSSLNTARPPTLSYSPHLFMGRKVRSKNSKITLKVILFILEQQPFEKNKFCVKMTRKSHL